MTDNFLKLTKPFYLHLKSFLSFLTVIYGVKIFTFSPKT